MKPLKPVLLTSFAILAMTTTALTTGALAQKGTTLSPSTKWSVLDVYDDSKPENSYCAVAKRFKPNTVLTLAKNKKNEASLALDFQTDKFSPQQSFEVILDPGAGQQRSYEVNPASKQAMVVRFGQDETFFNALAKTGYLRVEMVNESMNFDLADIDSGQDELGNCLATLDQKAVAKGGSGGVYGVDKPASTKTAAAASDLETLKNRVDYLSKENERLSQLAAEAEKAQQKDVASNEGSLQAKEAMVQELLQSVDALKSENNELQAQIKNAPDQSKAINDLSAEIAKLKEENSKIAAAAKSAENAQGGDQISVLSSEIASLKAENKKLQDSMTVAPHDEKAGDKAVESINAEMEALRKENIDLKAKSEGAAKSEITITELNKSLATLKKENEALATKLSASAAGVTPSEAQKAELDSLKEANKKLEAELAAQKEAQARDITAAKADLEKLSKENGELKASLMTYEKSQETIDALKQELAALKASKSDLQDQAISQAKTDATVSTLGEELAALKKENLDLKTKSEAAAKAITELENLNNKLASLETENASFKEQIKAHEISKAEAVTLAAQIDTLKKENEDIKTKLTAAEAGSAELAELKKTQASTDKELQALKDENTGLKTAAGKQGEAEAKIVSLNADVKVLTDENTTLKEENSSLKTKFAAAEGAQTKLGSVSTELETIKSENEKLKAALSAEGESEAKIVSLNADLAALKDENAKLKAEIEGATAVATTESAPIPDAEMEKLKAENASLKEAMTSKETVETKLASLEKEMEMLKTENADLKQKLETKPADIAATAADAQIAQGEIDALKKENEELKAKIETLSTAQQNIEVVDASGSQELLTKIEELEKEKKDLLTQLETAKTDVSAAPVEQGSKDQDSEVTLLKDQLAEKNSKIEQLTAIEKEYQTLQDENADMKVKLGMLSDSDAVKMQERVAELEKQNQNLRDSLQAQRPQQIAQATSPISAPSLQPQDPEVAHKIAKENINALVEDLDPRRTAPQKALVAASAPTKTPAPTTTPQEDAALLPKTQLRANPFEKVLDNAANPASAASAPQAQPAQPSQQSAPIAKAPPPPKEGMTDAQYQEMILAETLKTKNPPPQPIAPVQHVLKAISEPIPAQDKGPIIPAAPAVEKHPVAAAPEQQAATSASSPQAMAATPVPPPAEMQPPVQNAGGYYSPEFKVQDLLAAAHVADNQQINLVEKASNAQKVAYQWRSQGVFGSAEQAPMSNAAQFDANVKEYLEKTQKRCNGEFAVVPEQSMDMGATRVDSYEIACVGNNVNSSATLLFFNKDNTFTVLTHEAPVENMDVAMAFRDRVLEVIKKS